MPKKSNIDDRLAESTNFLHQTVMLPAESHDTSIIFSNRQDLILHPRFPLDPPGRQKLDETLQSQNSTPPQMRTCPFPLLLTLLAGILCYADSRNRSVWSL